MKTFIHLRQYSNYSLLESSFKINEIINLCKKHFNYLRNDKSEHLCVNLAKKHFSYYLKGFKGASAWRKAFMKTTIPDEINHLLEDMQKEYPA